MAQKQFLALRRWDHFATTVLYLWLGSRLGFGRGHTIREEVWLQQRLAEETSDEELWD